MSGTNQTSVKLEPNNVATLVCQDTIDVLQTLLARAQRGEIIGLTFCAIKRHRICTYGASGYAVEHPVLAIGGTNRLLCHLSNSIDKG